MESRKQLQGKRITCVAWHSIESDPRFRKEAQALVEAGVELTIVARRSLDNPEAWSWCTVVHPTIVQPKLCSSANNRFVRIALNLTWYRLGQWFWMRANPANVLLKEMVKLGQSIPADAIHCVNIYALNEAHAIAQSLGVPLIYDVYEYWAGALSNPYLANPAGLRYWLKKEKQHINDAHQVVTVSDRTGRKLKELYRIKDYEVVLNCPKTKVSETTPASKSPKLVYHGVVYRDRNMKGLLKALSLMSNQCTLDIYGSYEGGHESEVVDWIEEYGLTDRVVLHGRFNADEVIDIISQYDIGVYTAQMLEENFANTLPNKLFDCICAGIAVAMPDFPAIRDVVDAEEIGVLLDTSTPEGIARGLDAMLDNPDMLNTYKHNALNAAPSYTWDAQATKLISVYEQATGSSR